MSINFENEGVPIARCGKKKIHITDKEGDVNHGSKELHITKENEIFQLIPSDRERDIHYITGQSGSGKSWFAKNYINEYIKKHPKNSIYLFSSISDDPSIDSIKGLQRIDIKNPEFLDEDIELSDMKDSLVIFDDTDCIKEKNVRAKINGILNMILETGRHANISVIFTSHICCAGNDTKRILNETHSCTIFPKTLGNKSLKYLLDSYFGLDRDQIKKVKKMKGGRSVTIMKTYPMVIFNDKNMFMLNTDDD